MRARLVGGLLAAVLASDVALVAVRAGDEGGPTGSPPTPTASPTPSQVPADDLESRLLAPAGFERVSDVTARLGTLDAAGFASRFSTSPAETDEVRVGLTALGFESARGHLWVDDGAFYACVVVRLRTAASARTLVRSSLPEEGRFTSATVPGAATFVDSQGGFSVQHGLFARDRFVYEVTLSTTEPETDHARFDALLKQQRDHAERSDP